MSFVLQSDHEIVYYILRLNIDLNKVVKDAPGATVFFGSDIERFSCIKCFRTSESILLLISNVYGKRILWD